MKNTIKNYQKPLKLFLIFVFSSFHFLIFNNCTSNKLVPYATFYSFDYNGEKYRIRSVFTGDIASSFNELIYKEFLVRDYDKDGVLDNIIFGQINLPDVQTIYEYGLNELARQDKLRSINDKTQFYSYKNSKYNYEIKSFPSNNGQHFNVFKLSRINLVSFPDINVGVDQRADGSIDQIVKGEMSLDEIQALYTNVIKMGTVENRLVKVDDMILVK